MAREKLVEAMKEYIYGKGGSRHFILRVQNTRMFAYQHGVFRTA